MSGVRRNSRNKLDRYEIAMEADPVDLPEYQPRPIRHLANSKPTAVADTLSRLRPSSFGEIANKQVYLSTLQEEIQLLRSRIAKMEEEQGEKQARRTISHNQDGQLSDIPSQEGGHTQSRKSQVGRIYVRGSSPSSSKKVPKAVGKEVQSSFYKWHPRIDERQVSDFQIEEPSGKKLNPNESPEAKNRSINNYRVKHKNTKSIVQQKLPVPLEDRRQSKKKFKTEKMLSDYQEEKEAAKPAKQQKSVKVQQQKSLKVEQQKSVKIQQQKSVKVELEKPQQPEELKQVFLSNPDWQITSINDDFRLKIYSKIQIPAGFPLEPPKPSQSLEELEQRSIEIYKVFNISLAKCKEKVVVRKFKNGVYYQLLPNKNIVWYFSGAFYFGDWDTDLPSEAEKDGFGFQYIPGKYYYLGSFKNGTRNGKGTIKLINPSNSADCECLTYDGEWLNGKPHGHGCHIDERSNKYMGAFEHGEKTGKAVVLNHDGLYYEGELRNGLKNGHGVEKLINGDVYSGNFVEGLFEGIGTYTWKNGSVYTGQFSQGRREGKGAWKSYNGDQFEGSYSNDLKNGWGKFSWKNGQIYEGEFKDDIRNGVGSYRHPNGKIGTYFWVDGHIDHKIQTEQSSSSKLASSSKLDQVSTNIQSTL